MGKLTWGVEAKVVVRSVGPRYAGNAAEWNSHPSQILQLLFGLA